MENCSAISRSGSWTSLAESQDAPITGLCMYVFLFRSVFLKGTDFSLLVTMQTAWGTELPPSFSPKTGGRRPAGGTHGREVQRQRRHSRHSTIYPEQTKAQRGHVAGGLGLREGEPRLRLCGVSGPQPRGARGPFHVTQEGEGTPFRGVRCGSRESRPGPLDNR